MVSILSYSGSHVLFSRVIHLKCFEDELMALVVGDMPQRLRTSLERNVRNAFTVDMDGESVLQPRDSETDKMPTYPCLHFSYYARSRTEVSVVVGAFAIFFF